MELSESLLVCPALLFFVCLALFQIRLFLVQVACVSCVSFGRFVCSV